MIRYLPLSKYCNDSGDTVNTVNLWLKRGIWAYGVHVFKIDGIKERKVDLLEVDE